MWSDPLPRHTEHWPDLGLGREQGARSLSEIELYTRIDEFTEPGIYDGSFGTETVTVVTTVPSPFTQRQRRGSLLCPDGAILVRSELTVDVARVV